MRALAGLEAGVLGAIAMLAFLMLGSVWLRRTVWSMPNLMATVFYGSDAYGRGFGWAAIAGCALFVFVYGLLGVIWGVASPDGEFPFRTLAGAVAGLAVYCLLFGFLWKHTWPLISLYAPDRQLQIAHIVWGIVVARSSASHTGAIAPAGASRSGAITL